MQVSVQTKKTYDRKETIFIPYFSEYKDVLKRFNNTDSQFLESYIKETEFGKEDSALLKIPEMGNNVLLCGLSDVGKSIAKAVREYQNRADNLVFDTDLFKPIAVNESVLITQIVKACVLGSYNGMDENTEGLSEVKMKKATIVVAEEKLESARATLQSAVENTNTTHNARMFANNDFYDKSVDSFVEALRKDLTKRLKVKVSKLKDIKSARFNGLSFLSEFSSEEPALIVSEHRPEKGKTIVLASAILLTPMMGDIKNSISGNLSAGIVRAMMQNYSIYEKDHNVVMVVSVAKIDNPESIYSKRVRLASGSSYVINSKMGIVNVLLAEAIYQASKYKPRQIISFYANSRGFSSFLGKRIAGFISNSEALNKKIGDAGVNVSEDIWRLPLMYHKNILERRTYELSTGENAGDYISDARILEGNASGYPWMHIDFSSFSYCDRSNATDSRGSSGFGAALLNEYLKLVFKK